MATLIFRLNGVSEQEAEEVRQLLRDHDLEFYETSAGRWGISVAGIWLVDDARQPRARQLLEDYGQQRQQQVRGELAEARQRGELPSLWQRVRQAPLHYLVVLLLAAGILYISIWPFLNSGAQ